MRGFLRLLTVSLALAVAAAGGLLTVEVAARWSGRGPVLVPWPGWRARLEELTWQADEVRVAAAVTVAVGVLLIVAAALARGRAVPLTDPATGVSVTTSPRSLARVVGQRVRAEDDVTGATVTASRRKVRVRALSALRTEQQLRPHLTAVVTELLDDLPLRRTPAVSVIVDSPKDRP